jgi:hypothetical protein
MQERIIGRMDSKAGFVAVGVGVGVGIGSALMYWFDPSVGKRRRSHMRYEAKCVVKQVQKTIDRTADDLAKISRMKVGKMASALVPAVLK